MHNSAFRSWLIFFVLVWFVVSVKTTFANFLFSIWVGGWVMSKVFKYLFNAKKDTANLAWYQFIPPRYFLIDLIFSSEERKPLAMIVIWWQIGIVSAFVIYKILDRLLLS